MAAIAVEHRAVEHDDATAAVVRASSSISTCGYPILVVRHFASPPDGPPRAALQAFPDGRQGEVAGDAVPLDQPDDEVHRSTER